MAALAAEADLLVLDEPTSGLDPLMEQAFQQCVRERREDGVAVLLSSHILDEVEALADRVSIIRRGRTVTTGSLADLRRHTRTSVHAVTAEEPDGLARAEGVADYVCERLDGHVDTRFTIDADHLDATIGRLHAARIHTLTVTPPSLDALFLRSYGERRRRAARPTRRSPRRRDERRRTSRLPAGAGWGPWSGSSGGRTAAASSSG